MKKIIFNPSTLAPPVGHFDRAVQLGDWLFISGTSALTNVQGDLNDRKLVSGIEAQTRETIDNIERVMKAAGGSLDQIYELRITMTNAKEFGVVGSVLKERMPKKGFIAHAYEGTMVIPEMLIEIEAKAYLGSLE